MSLPYSAATAGGRALQELQKVLDKFGADIAEIEDRHRRDIERLWSHRSEDVGKLGVHADRGTLLGAYRELVEVLRTVGDILASDSIEYDDVRNAVQLIDAALAGAPHPEQRPAQQSMVAGDTLPISLWQFEQRANVLLSNEQEKASPDNALIGFICDAVRLARENARQHPEQQPDIDAFLGEDRKPVRSLASVMVPSARDPEQQPDSDARASSYLAVERAITASKDPNAKWPDSDARDGRDRIAYAPFGRCAKCGEAITSFHNTGHCKSAP